MYSQPIQYIDKRRQYNITGVNTLLSAYMLCETSKLSNILNVKKYSISHTK